MAYFSALNNDGISGNGIQFGSIGVIVSSGFTSAPVIEPTEGAADFNDGGHLSITGKDLGFVQPDYLTGYVDSITYSNPAFAPVPIFSISDFCLPFEFIAGLFTGGDELAILEELFKRDDRFLGSTASDLLKGFCGDDVLYSKEGDDTLVGGAGNDKLVGGEGADALIGGDGIDWAYYHEANAGVIASLADPSVNTGEAAGDTYDSVENLWGTVFADTLTGDGGANVLFGNEGNDVLNGGGADDSLQGANGNDILNGDGGADGMYGGYGVDTLNGGDGDDRLVGGAGADVLNGGAGLDWAYYHTGTVGVTVNLAANTGSGGDAQGDIYSSIENLYGSAYSDSLTGNGQTNVLLGNTGADTLTGGGANDLFIFRAVTDSTVAAAGRDTITDFSSAQGDKIDLRPIDADGDGGNGNAAFAFTAGGAFTGIGHEVIVQGSGGTCTVLADVNGDSTADFAINVTSVSALVATDFLL